MSVSATGSASIPPSIPAPPTAKAPARAADGDYVKANMQTSQAKDSDGDYKPNGAALATSSPNVQAALTTLKKGG